MTKQEQIPRFARDDEPSARDDKPRARDEKPKSRSLAALVMTKAGARDDKPGALCSAGDAAATYNSLLAKAAA
jgi:hypothetical protein